VSSSTWRASASIDSLKKYAQILQDIRAYFQRQDVLEVCVPCIASRTSPATHLDSIKVENPLFDHPADSLEGGPELTFFLQTSPEFFMKRLLCGGSGPIYRMGSSFRRGELSRRHNPEFTMLEWYRPDWHYHQLMDDVERLVISIFGDLNIERISYQALFFEYTELDPHSAEVSLLAQFAQQKLGYQSPEPTGMPGSEQAKNELLELIFSGYIIPKTCQRSLFVFEFPAGQAELSETAVDKFGNIVAHRFELYLKGIELANGYQELTDVGELQRRFNLWNEQRKQLGKKVIEPDSQLMAAQQQGLPSCSGVAMGVDRLVMCLLGSAHISDVLAFPIDRA
jgi:lysyl-tRNA synthetase class 2